MCSNDRESIGCSTGSLVIVNATYGSDGRQCGAGRHDVTTCNPRWTRQVLTTLCTGRPSCRLSPNLDLHGFNCQVRNGQLEVNYTCLSGAHFIALDGRTTAVLSDSGIASGYLLFAANGNVVNNSLVYELQLNLTHLFHVDLTPLMLYPAFSSCDNFKMTTFSPHGKSTLCGEKSRLNMQIINSSVTTVVFHFSVNSLKELLLPFLVSSCDLSEITLSSYDDLVINVVEQTLEVSCREGYTRTTSDVTVCRNSVWAGSVSVCEEITCPVLGTIPHGQVLFKDRKWRSVATYSCLLRYTLIGSDKRRCQSDGTWSGSPPVCNRAFCLPPEVSAPAKYAPNDTQDYDVGASVTFTCQLGFDLIGQDVITCSTNSSWSHPSPTCEIVDCGVPDTLNNSLHNYSSTTYGSEATFTCQSSDEFQAEDTVTCSDSGRWSSTSLTCPQILPVKTQSMCSGELITIKCPRGEKVVVVNATYGYHGNSSCNVTSTDTSGCSSRWTTQVLTTLCTGKSVCSIRPSTDLQGSQCQVNDAQLDFNFTCVSSDHFVQMENGTSVLSDSISWGCLLPGAKDDSGPEPLPRAEVDLTKVNKSVYLDFAAVNSLPLPESCDILDLTLRGPSGDKTFCKEEIKSLHVIFVDSSVTTLDIRWNIPSGNDTRIVVPFLVTECEPKVDMTGGNNLLSVDIGMQRLETICPEGYYKAHRSVCVGGMWLGNDSSCLPVSCPNIGTIPNGQLQLTGGTFGHVARYSCLRKFRLIGNSERVCQYTGTWSGITPRCQRIYCRMPAPPERGWFTPNTTHFFEVETLLVFRCQKGTTLVGQSVIACTRNSTWSSDVPTCQLVDCGFPPKPSFSSVTFTSTTYNSRAEYFCDSNPPDVIHVANCAEDGRWTSGKINCLSPTSTAASSPSPLYPTPSPMSEEDDDEDDDDADLSTSVTLGIIFGAVAFVLILLIIGCVLCSFTTKHWRRTQMVGNLSDIVADTRVTDIRETPITQVYIIKNKHVSHHERAGQDQVDEHCHPLTDNTNNYNQENHINKNEEKKKAAAVPIRMGNGISSKHKHEEIPHHISSGQPDPNHSQIPFVNVNGHHGKHTNHNVNHVNRVNNVNSVNHVHNHKMNGLKPHVIPLGPNSTQPHTCHTTRL